jgi:dTDP-4-dehydrorhamnose 3,5-epimerase
MEIRSLSLPEVKLLKPRPLADDRGRFVEIFNRRTLAEAGIAVDFCQDNQVLSARRGTVRGLHFQAPPHDQWKLVHVLRGAILDVVVDIRRGSPRWGRHVAVRLDAEGGDQILIPSGFAHGYCSLVDDTEVFYKVSAFYAPAAEGGILWNDPALGIDWQVAEPILSPRDAALPRLRDFASPFGHAAGEAA